MPAPEGHEAYPGCETGGRPTKYTPEKIDAFADELLQWLKCPTNVWFKDFCINMDIDPDYMSEWAAENEKFSGAYRLAKARQESRLVNGGLLNAFNPGIVKFVLQNAHNWREKTEISGDAANPLGCVLKTIDGQTKSLIHDEKE